MEYIAGQIEWYRRLCFVCLGGMTVSLVCSVCLFVKLDIRRVIGYLSGFSERREVKRMKRLRGNPEGQTIIMGGNRK